MQGGEFGLRAAGLAGLQTSLLAAFPVSDNRLVTGWVRIIGLGLVLAGASACTKAQARTPVPPPPLNTPTPPVSAPLPVSPAEPAAPLILQTTSNPAEVEQRANAQIAAAQRDLDRINPAQLTSNARAQYDTAKGFIRQAQDALKVKNVVLAKELADKAAALASQLRR